MSGMILETFGLRREFSGFVAVDNVDLKVREGSICALIGPNGAGKTTCFNLLTKFLQPTRGEIRFKGSDITGKKPAEVARLGSPRVPDLAVFLGLTALENVGIALQRARGNRSTSGARSAGLGMFDERARELLHDVASRVGRAPRRPSALWPQAGAGDRDDAGP